MKKKRIVFVANSSWSILKFRKKILEHLIFKEYDVFVYAPPDQSVQKLIAIGCKYRELFLSRKGLNPFVDFLTFLNLVFFYFLDRPAFAFHYTVKPNIWGTIAAKMVCVPSVAVVTGLGHVFIKQNPLTRVVSGLYKLAFMFPREVWFLNDDDLNEFLCRKIVGKVKTRVLPGEGIDLSEFVVCREGPSDPTFLMVSRMLWDKGVREYVEAAKAVKRKRIDVKFQLLGPIDDGNPAAVPIEQIRAWSQLGIIEYLGYADDVRPYMRGCTAVVLPSYREGVPLTLLEASAIGRPLIASNVPGCRTVVDDGENGFLVKARSGEELAAAIEKILSFSRSDWSFFANNARQKVEQIFEIKEVIKQYDDVLEFMSVKG